MDDVTFTLKGTRMSFSKRVAAIAASGVVTLGVLIGVDAVPASAATVECSGDVCAEVVSVASAGFTFDMWANTSTFFGHFDVYWTNGGINNNVPENADITLNPGVVYSVLVPQNDGGYDVIAWKYISPGDNENIGEVGFSVHLGR